MYLKILWSVGSSLFSLKIISVLFPQTGQDSFMITPFKVAEGWARLFQPIHSLGPTQIPVDYFTFSPNTLIDRHLHALIWGDIGSCVAMSCLFYVKNSSPFFLFIFRCIRTGLPLFRFLIDYDS